MTRYFLDDEKIVTGHFDSRQIEAYTKELGSRLEAIIYLWAFNNFSVHSPDDLKDYGRPMYRKLAKKLSKILCEDNKQQAEIDRLRKIIEKEYEQLCRIDDCSRNTTAFWQIESAKVGLKRALNGESEEK